MIIKKVCMSKELKRYDILYADPPWQYKAWNKKENEGTAEKHYKTQSLDFLKNMNVVALCNPNSILFMWATFPCLEMAFELAKAWGFKYKTVAFVWIKTNIGNGKPVLGMGHYTRANAEVVLLFTKGKSLERMSKSVSQVYIGPRTIHSEKPHEIRRRIVDLYGNLSRLELFARDKVPYNGEYEGWDLFGDEVSNSIEIPFK